MRVAEYEKTASYDRNHDKADHNEPFCIVCGKNVKAGAQMVEIIDYGATVVLEGGSVDDETSLGGFDIGPDCYKRLMKVSTER